MLHPWAWYLPFGLGTHTCKDPNGTERPWLVATAVPKLVFDLSHSIFPLFCPWPNQHKENVITGAGSAVTMETKQTSSAPPERGPNPLLLQAGEEGTEQQHPYPVWQEWGQGQQGGWCHQYVPA